MDKLLEELCEIFEMDSIPLGSRMHELPTWDSLNALSVIALLDSSYGLKMDAAGLQKFATVREFVDHVIGAGR